MNKSLQHTIMAAAAALMAGCAATNPPLMFGDSTTYGLRLGNDTATAGGSVSFGYKAQSVAVVPVSVLNESGVPKLLNGHGDNGLRDALSVFASFQTTAGDKATDKAAQTVRLGQVFSTGLAAQALTMGYLCRESDDSRCANSTADNAAVAAAKNTAAQQVAQPQRRLDLAPSVAEASDERPYQAPLLFLRTDVVGINIGGSLAEQGLKFDLGYTNRNLALVPVFAPGAGKKMYGLFGRVDPTDADARPTDALQDAYSVLGQFSANTETAKLGLGLERYFATGVAAYNLGESLRTVIARAPAAPAPAASAAVTSAVARAGTR